MIPCRREIEEPALVLISSVHVIYTCDYNWFCYLPGARSAARLADVRNASEMRGRRGVHGSVRIVGAG